MFLPTINKFVYSYRLKNPCFGIQWTLGKHFLPLAGWGSVFPAKSHQGAWRSGSWLARGQVYMVDEAKLHSPIRSTSKVLVVQRAARRCREELSPLCSPVLDAGAAVHCASHPFAEHTSQMWWFRQDSEICSGSDGQQTAKQRPWRFFGESLALGSALELLFSTTTELVIADCYKKSTFCHTSQLVREMVHCYCTE